MTMKTLSVSSALVLCVVGATSLFGQPAARPPAAQTPPSLPGPPPPEALPNATAHPVVYLWPNGAPGSESKANVEERYRVAGSTANGDVLISSGVHRPSITVYRPPRKIATGAAVVVAPGGGFSEIWITTEGYRVAEYLSRRGIAAFVLKYRLPREKDSIYTMEDSLADLQRALRVVKSRAFEWDVDAERVGVMGFSAGGMLAGMAGARFAEPVKHPVDSTDQLSAKPAFQALIYGTPYGGTMGSAIGQLPKDMPPTFLACGGADPIAANYPDVYKMLKEAGVVTELHIYAGVPHGFAIQGNSPSSVASWPDRLRDWMFDLGLLTK